MEELTQTLMTERSPVLSMRERGHQVSADHILHAISILLREQQFDQRPSSDIKFRTFGYSAAKISMQITLWLCYDRHPQS